ncbi:MAG: NUDIX hydrolase [Candidatus Paceibacterota bacterium]
MKVRKKFRPTVSIALIQNSSVLFVQSAKDCTGNTWLLPQGGIHAFERIDEAIVREVKEELGFCPNISSMSMLGEYVNVLPRERKEKKPKLMICIGVYGEFPSLFKLSDENRSAIRVKNLGHMWNLMGEMCTRRPSKVIGTCHALERAHQRTMLPWSCRPLLDQLEIAGSYAA